MFEMHIRDHLRPHPVLSISKGSHCCQFSSQAKLAAKRPDVGIIITL